MPGGLSKPAMEAMLTMCPCLRVLKSGNERLAAAQNAFEIDVHDIIPVISLNQSVGPPMQPRVIDQDVDAALTFSQARRAKRKHPFPLR